MRIRRTAHHTVMALCAALIALGTGGCGGGVSTSDAPGGTPPAPKAVIALSTNGTLSAGTAIGGLGVTVNLPDTVTVKTAPGGTVESGVVITSGVAAGQATVLALYSGATATAPAKLYLVLASGSSGMPVGEFATVTCDVKSGIKPAGSDFSLNDFSAVDTSGVSIPSLTAGLSEKVQ
jgi:hypothetical protein